MNRLLLPILLLLASSGFSLDHLYSIRAGLGTSTFRGSDAPKDVNMGLSGSIGAVGAQAFYAAGPLWGTELSLSNSSVTRDTVLFSDETGDWTDKTEFEQSFTKVTFGLFLMKNWDFGLNILAGPQVSYLANCMRTVGSQELSCTDDYEIYQLEAQGSILFFIMETFGIDVKYSQSVLPFDKEGNDKIFLSTASVGISYIF